jgi:hypothetical protein
MSLLSRAPSPAGAITFARRFARSRRVHPPSTTGSTRRRGVATFNLVASLRLGLFIVGWSLAIFRMRVGL